MSTFTELLTRYAFVSQERQQRLGDWVGDGGFSMDFPARRISWAGGPSARCDLLGTEAGGTWLWAWANEHLDLDQEVLGAAHSLRRLGTELGVQELVEPGFPVDDLRTGHALGAVAAGLLGTDGHYFGHGTGTAVLTLVTAPALALPAADALLLSGVLVRALGVFPVPHAEAARAYLEQRGAAVTVAADGSWAVEAPAGGRLTLTFDALGRLATTRLEQGPGVDAARADGPAQRRRWRRR